MFEHFERRRRLFGRTRFTVSDPDLVRHVLVDNAANYARTPLTIPAYISLSRAIAADPAVDAALEQLKAKGVRIVHDTCTYYGSLLGDVDGVVATNSLTWAAYGRANLCVQPALMAMPQCVAAAITGHVPAHPVYGDRHGLD